MSGAHYPRLILSLFRKKELAQNLGPALAMLADWRSQHKGPAYVKVGPTDLAPARLGCCP